MLPEEERPLQFVCGAAVHGPGVRAWGGPARAARSTLAGNLVPDGWSCILVFTVGLTPEPGCLGKVPPESSASRLAAGLTLPGRWARDLCFTPASPPGAGGRVALVRPLYIYTLVSEASFSLQSGRCAHPGGCVPSRGRVSPTGRGQLAAWARSVWALGQAAGLPSRLHGAN
jgi:hypothetical protein